MDFRKGNARIVKKNIPFRVARNRKLWRSRIGDVRRDVARKKNIIVLIFN